MYIKSVPRLNFPPLTAGLALVMLLMLTSVAIIPVNAQSFTGCYGYIYSEEGIPLPGVTIKLTNYPASTVTNFEGEYELRNIPPGDYTLEISALNFIDQSSVIQITQRKNLRHDFYLQPKIFKEPESIVYGERDQSLLDKEVIEIEENTESFDQLFRKTSGVVLANDGKGGGRLSINGSNLDQVTILIDGQPLVADGTGEGRLNNLNIDNFEKMEIYKYNIPAKYGSEAIGGVVNLVSHKPNSSDDDILEVGLKTGLGSYAQRRVELYMNSGLFQRCQLKIGYNFHSLKNNFDYQFRETDYIRENNYVKNHDLNANIKGFLPTQQDELQLEFGYNFNEEGLPGVISAPQEVSFQKNNLFSSRLHYKRIISKIFYSESSCQLQHLTNYYNIPEDDGLYPVNSLYRLEKLHFHTNVVGLPTRFLELNLGFVYNKEIYNTVDSLNRDFDISDKIHENLSLFSDIYLDTRLTSFLGGKVTLGDEFVHSGLYKNLTHTPRITIATNFFRCGLFTLALSISWGKYINDPSFNQLYWVSNIFYKSNPGLRPERSEKLSGALQLRDINIKDGLFTLEVGTVFFKNNIDSIISWRKAFDGRYFPDNYAKALITGREDNLQVGLLDRRIKFNYSNTCLTPLNKTQNRVSKDKILPFRPQYSEKYSIELRPLPALSIELSQEQVGKRYIREANTKYLDAYKTLNFTAGYTFKALGLEVSNHLRIDNILDERYYILEDYPLPGITYNYKLSLKINNREEGE